MVTSSRINELDRSILDDSAAVIEAE